MSNVTTRWILELAEKVTGPLARITRAVTGTEGIVGRLQQRFAGLGRNISAAFSQIPGIGNAISLATNPMALATTAVLAFTTAGTFATKSAYNFEEGIAKINATAQMSGKELGGLRNQLMNIGADSGGNFQRIPESFEKILSQVGDTTQSLDILQASTKGAKAGFTDLDVVSGALAQSMSIIGDQRTKAQDVLDTFFAAKRIGAGEFKDFATYIPTLIAGGKNLGLEYRNVAGLFAYMTGKGQSAADASMLLQNAFSALSKSDITSGMKKLGVNVFDKNGAIRDIGAIMTELGSKLNGLSNEKKLNILESIGLNDVQARNAFAILTSDTNKLTEALNACNNAAGETANALALTQNPANNWREIMDKINFIMTKIGYKILPYVDAVLIKVGAAMQWVKDHGAVLKDVLAGIGNAFSIVWTIVKWLTIALSPLIVVMGILGVVTFIATSPFTALALVFVGLVTLITVLWRRSETFRGTIMGLWSVIKGFGGAIKTFVIDSLHKMLSGITGVGQAIYKLFTGDFKGAFEAGKQAVQDLVAVSPVGMVARFGSAMYDQGKQSGELFQQGKMDGIAAVSEKKLKEGGFLDNMNFGNGSVDANSVGNNKPAQGTPDLSGLLGDKKKEKSAGSGSGSGSGHTINMRLDFKQTFNANSKVDIDEIAKEIVAKINDKLRDAVVAIG